MIGKVARRSRALRYLQSFMAVLLVFSFISFGFVNTASSVTYNSMTKTIWAGQNNNAGSVTVSNDKDTLYVSWNLANG